MSNYISLFGEHTEYTSYVRSEGFVMPNVSYCAVGKHVHFNPRVDWIDPEFKRVVLNAFNNGDEMYPFDLEDITQEEWNQVVYANGSIFKNNAVIESIADMEKFPNVHVLENETFTNCTGVTGDLVIPSNITGVKAYVFSGMTGVTGLVVDHDVAFVGTEQNWGAETFGNLTGVEGVIDLRHLTSISGYHEFGSFGKNGSGCQVIMPGLSRSFAVWFIGAKITAMAGSPADLEAGTIKIPEGYTKGGQLAFDSATGFSRIICPESMTTFDNFSGGTESWNNVRYFEMGSNTTELKGAVCAANGYQNRTTVVVCKAAVPPTILQGGYGHGGNTDYNFPFMSTRVSALYVPDASVQDYANSSTIVAQAPTEYSYLATLDQNVEIGWKRFADAGVLHPLSDLT